LKGEGTELSLQNPKDRSDLGLHIHAASQADVDRAVKHARTALKGEWASWTGTKRGEALYKLAMLIKDNKNELAYLESICSGKPISHQLKEIEAMQETLKCTPYLTVHTC
jgi:acyl-CoA reductase-like NAD-dependent aldehyde dehydrogenase